MSYTLRKFEDDLRELPAIDEEQDVWVYTEDDAYLVQGVKLNALGAVLIMARRASE